MPRMWHINRDLVPSSGGAEEAPREMPDGRLVCGPHGLAICARCCVDFTYMQPDDEDGDGEEWKPPLTKGTGLVFPSRFVPPSEYIAPLHLFSNRRSSSSGKRFRFCHRDDDGMLLIFTDGACLSNGQAEPRAGWAIIDGEDARGEPEKLAGRLEKRGPFNAPCVQTNNRAELRAVLAALRSHFWPSEGFHTVVVATDSEYVVEGATTWACEWVCNAWRKNAYADVKNRDLWEALLGEVEEYKGRGLTVKLWRIPRAWNADADAAAKEAAATHAAKDYWVDTSRH